MFWKFLRESFWRPGSRHHTLWAVLAVALGTTVTAATLSVSLDIGDKMAEELRSLGANIVITPAADSLPVEIGGIDYRPVSEGAYINESSLPKLKEIFWRNNIVAFAPFLYVPVRVLSGRTAGNSTMLVGTWFDHPFMTTAGERFATGIRSLNPTWKLEGDWIDDSSPPVPARNLNAPVTPGSTSPEHPNAPGTLSSGESEMACLVGKSLAESLRLELGGTMSLAPQNSEAKAAGDGGAANASPVSPTTLCRIKGILTTGGAEDSQVFTSLAMAQSLAGSEGKVRKVQASALTKPEDERSKRDPSTMTPAEYDRWYCSPYISSILHQIGEVLPGTTSRQVQPVAETQGRVLSKLAFLMGMLALLALAAAVLSISSIASLRVLKRRQEISLMKAIGAQDRLVASLFLSEAALQGILGAMLGFVAGLILARTVERLVFGSQLVVNWMLLPLILLIGLAVSFMGTWGPVKLAMNYEPATVLRGE